MSKRQIMQLVFKMTDGVNVTLDDAIQAVADLCELPVSEVEKAIL